MGGMMLWEFSDVTSASEEQANDYTTSLLLLYKRTYEHNFRVRVLFIPRQFDI